MKQGMLIGILAAAAVFLTGCAGNSEPEHTGSGPQPYTLTESGERYDVAVYTAETLPDTQKIRVVSSDPLPWPENLAGIGIRRDQILSVNGVGAVLYPDFEDPDTALLEITEACPGILTELQEAYSLEPLADKNVDVYRSALRLYQKEPDRPDRFRKDTEESEKLDSFLDIYANSYQNERLVRLAGEAGSVENLLGEEEFVRLLPDGVRQPFCSRLRETVLQRDS